MEGVISGYQWILGYQRILGDIKGSQDIIGYQWTKEGWWWDQHSKSGGRSAPVGRSLLEVLYLGGVVSLALHLFHDRCCNCCPSNVLIRKLAIFEILQCPPFAVSLTNTFM